ncbi:MAG: single-stranded DNA-binding protein [Spirochaetales bacterium]|nr:single-stranded DNA-binding protein [Spirochaetales bacterium]
MSDINVVVLVGRLTRDSELKYTPSGLPICRFSLAVNRSRKQDEQWVDEPHFFDVEFYGKSAEGLARYLLKGRQVAVQGELRQDRWEKDGQQRSKIVVVAATVRPIGPAPAGDAGKGRYAQEPNGTKTDQFANGNGQAPIPPGIDEFADDIPF